jgi:ubiquinone/menaquinone biosynthesis C-methylase UbiE
MINKSTSEKIQAEYYQRTAEGYDELHVSQTDNDHTKALYILSSYISYYNIKSILDIGSGTGRTLLYLKEKYPNIRVVGVEPVKELREQGYKKGLSENELMDGNGYQLFFKNGEFDLVCEFGVLHHVRHPHKVIGEMLRIADKGIFISDSNNFGQGGFIARTVKQLINSIHLWPAYNFIKTKGKVYHISEGDGLFYSYSVYNNFKQINEQCDVFVTNTSPAAKNLYRTANHIVLFGKKNKNDRKYKVKN